jgi:hypothetical protein
MRFLAPPHQWFLKLTFLKTELWVYDARVNLGKHRVVCGVSWLLRVTDHEAVLMDPKLFLSWVHRSVVLLIETGVWTADKQPVALLAKKMAG